MIMITDEQVTRFYNSQAWKRTRPGPAERKVVEGNVMKKEDEKETDSAAELGRFVDNMDNIKDDPWRAMEPLMKIFFGRKVKKH